MQVKEAMDLLWQATEENGYLEVSQSQPAYITINGKDHFDESLIDAFHTMVSRGVLVQAPTSGQCRPTISFRRPHRDDYLSATRSSI